MRPHPRGRIGGNTGRLRRLYGLENPRGPFLPPRSFQNIERIIIRPILLYSSFGNWQFCRWKKNYVVGVVFVNVPMHTTERPALQE